jgi:hypothetical protein
LTQTGLAIALFRVYDFDDTSVEVDRGRLQMERRLAAICAAAAAEH